MNISPLHYTLIVDRHRCIGCCHCMSVCPTDAIRIRKGKPIIFKDRCIDCGKCYRICPESAITVEQDDFQNIFNFKRRVALLPSILKGQFPEDISKKQIHSVILDMGFTDIFEVGFMWPIFHMATARYIKNNQKSGPCISSFCPSVVRLIQSRFPSLLGKVIPMKSPVDIAALYYRRFLEKQGVPFGDTGIFYVTPCAAKISAVHGNDHEKDPILSGVINMDYIYNRAYRRIRQGTGNKCRLPELTGQCSRGLLWSLTNGESAYAPGRSLAIDGINNVMEFLENLENEDIQDIDFLELRSCDESCAGGVLTTRNRFLTVERLRNRAEQANIKNQDKTSRIRDDIEEESEYLMDNIMLGELPARSTIQLDDDMGKAMVKMQKKRSILKSLPGVDCGLCGAPTCESLADDIVRDMGRYSQCVFVQKRMVRKEKMDSEKPFDIMDDIWGRVEES